MASAADTPLQGDNTVAHCPASLEGRLGRTPLHLDTGQLRGLGLQKKGNQLLLKAQGRSKAT